MKIAPFLHDNGINAVYVITDPQDPAETIEHVHNVIAGLQVAAFANFSVPTEDSQAADCPKDDEAQEQPHTTAMNDIRRQEIDLKLQLIEERLDRKVTDIANAVTDIKGTNVATQTAVSNAKWWAIGTAIAVLAIFLGTLQWGLQSQKEENARFNSYVREDIKSISESVKEISKAVTELRIKAEAQQPATKQE